MASLVDRAKRRVQLLIRYKPASRTRSPSTPLEENVLTSGMTDNDRLKRIRADVSQASMFGGNGGSYGGECGEGYGLGYVAGGGRLQQYAHFAPHQTWHHHAHHDTYGNHSC
ncbi:unnamed protein product, partial [Brenthis ino]